MPEYDKMYKSLWGAVTQAITILQESQLETEEIYISSEPAAIKILHDNFEHYENKNAEDTLTENSNNTLIKIIGENIQALRSKHSMSLEELSDELGMTPGYLGLVERGRRSVTADNLLCLSNVFSISIDDLFRPLNLESKEVTELSAT